MVMSTREPQYLRQRRARAIKKARQAKELSQQDLANLAGYTRQAISLMEKTGGITEQGRRVLAQALGIDPEMLA
jgi:transcriptional regulator with XRE-family HTH domain